MVVWQGNRWTYPLRLGVRTPYGGNRYHDGMAHLHLYRDKNNKYHMTVKIETPEHNMRVLLAVPVITEMLKIMHSDGRDYKRLNKRQRDLLYRKWEDIQKQKNQLATKQK